MVKYPAIPSIETLPIDTNNELRNMLIKIIELLEMATTTRGGELSKMVTKQMLEDAGFDTLMLEEGEPKYDFSSLL